jgi:hypothetical protein
VVRVEPKRILIVANQTAAGEHLKALVKEKMNEGPCSFTVLVPATPGSEHLTWTEGEARAIAEQRMNDAVSGIRELGADVQGVVGDAQPLMAIGDLLLEMPQDEIVLSTLPIRASRWLKQDLPHKVERQFGLPVTHVVGEPAGTP